MKEDKKRTHCDQCSKKCPIESLRCKKGIKKYGNEAKISSK